MSAAEGEKPTELTPNQVVAIESIVAGATILKAAADADVDRSTIYRWMALPQFKKVLIERRNDLVDGIRAETAGLLSAAVETYRKAMAGQEVSTAAYKAAADILRAARIIGDNVVQAIPDDVTIEFADPSPDGDNKTDGDVPTAGSDPQPST